MGFYILGTSIGSRSFVESFVAKVFHENLGTTSNLPMLVDPQAIFVIFLLCYARCHGYLFCIVFPSPYILQHYAKFDTRTITMLEKLLSAGSFRGFIDHLACHQAILPTSLGKFGLLSIVWATTFTLLGCWALINLTLIHF